MPREHEAIGHRFSIAGQERQIVAGKYENGEVGEISVGEASSFSPSMQGMLVAFGTAVSIALQHGVPLELLVKSFVGLRFEPGGITGNPEIPFAKSIPDYAMRWLASRFIGDADFLDDLGIMTPEVRARREVQLGCRLYVPAADPSKAELAQAFARLAHEGDRLGEEDADRVADLHRLLVGGPVQFEAGDRGDGHLDRELDRVVGPGDALRGLHLLRQLFHASAELLGIAKQVEALHRSPCKQNRHTADGDLALSARHSCGVPL
jgi:hypothetical protein